MKKLSLWHSFQMCLKYFKRWFSLFCFSLLRLRKIKVRQRRNYWDFCVEGEMWKSDKHFIGSMSWEYFKNNFCVKNKSSWVRNVYMCSLKKTLHMRLKIINFFKFSFSFLLRLRIFFFSISKEATKRKIIVNAKKTMKLIFLHCRMFFIVILAWKELK